MKANRAQIERALKSPPSETRFFLLYGPDESSSRSLARSLAAPGSERVDLAGAELRLDPARLADEAASISLFGGARHIIVEPAGDEIVPAVEALVQAPAAGNPVAIVAGALKPASRLLKLALAAPCSMAFASYAPEGRDADKLVIDLAREHGLDVRPDVARRIAASAAANRALIEQELRKLALFLDASAERPQQIDHDALDAVGAANEEGDLTRLVDSVGGGDAAMLKSELLRLSNEGVEGIPLIRPVLRRMTLLAKLRAEVEAGNSVASVMASQGKSLFWKEKDTVAGQLVRWRSDVLAKSIGRLLTAERQLKTPGALGTVAVDEELFAICRQAARQH